jgi:hypothetical protein
VVPVAMLSRSSGDVQSSRNTLPDALDGVLALADRAPSAQHNDSKQRKANLVRERSMKEHSLRAKGQPS